MKAFGRTRPVCTNDEGNDEGINEKGKRRAALYACATHAQPKPPRQKEKKKKKNWTSPFATPARTPALK
jgi:hypothetical protein